MQHEIPYRGGDESLRDSLESSEISSDAFSHNFRQQQQRNNFNHITQHIQNNNNKITIIIKHNDGPETQQNNTQQIIYIQPAMSSQPNLNLNNQIGSSSNDITAAEIYNSLDDLESDEHYQFYNENAIDVPDDFKRNSYLVLNLNDAANKRLKRRICTPTRNLLPIPPKNNQRKYSTMNMSSGSLLQHDKIIEEESRKVNKL